MSLNNSSIVSFCCFTKISLLEPRLKFKVRGREIGRARQTFQFGSRLYLSHVDTLQQDALSFCFTLDLLQASLSFKFEIVRKMRKLKNKEKKKRKRGKGEACSKSSFTSSYQNLVKLHMKLQNVCFNKPLPTHVRWIAILYYKNGVDKFWRRVVHRYVSAVIPALFLLKWVIKGLFEVFQGSVSIPFIWSEENWMLHRSVITGFYYRCE